MNPRKHVFVKGKTFGRLTLNSASGQLWVCLCECGSVKTARATDIVRGRIKSCGCLEEENRVLHNQRQSDVTRRLGNSEHMPSGCIEFRGRLNACGYGVLRINGRSTLAHRAAHELHVGPIPDGLQVLHTCDNPACINPDHLWLGTHTDNMRDMASKGRGRRAPRFYA
jgi:HNH endonuclease